MKNIHLKSTDEPSILQLKMDGNLHIEDGQTIAIKSYKYIYITILENLNLDGYHFNSKYGDSLQKTSQRDIYSAAFWEEEGYIIEKVVLTNDPKLIKEGIQEIDKGFLEWFVKNPNCKYVKVKSFHGVKTSIAEINTISDDGSENWKGVGDYRDYKILIPKEEHKHIPYNGNVWEPDISYNEVISLIQFLSMNEEFSNYSSISKETAKYFLDKFKNQEITKKNKI